MYAVKKPLHLYINSMEMANGKYEVSPSILELPEHDGKGFGALATLCDDVEELLPLS
jgi:hypothetical protein